MGPLGPEQQTVPSYQVTYNTYLASRRWMLNTPSVECVGGWTTQPVSSANFCHFLITSCSDEKRYQALATFRTARDGKLSGTLSYHTLLTTVSDTSHSYCCDKIQVLGVTLFRKWVEKGSVLLYMELLSLYSQFYGNCFGVSEGTLVCAGPPVMLLYPTPLLGPCIEERTYYYTSLP